MLQKIIEENKINIEGFSMIKPVYEIDNKNVAWMSNGNIYMYIIYRDNKLIDIQID